MFLSHSRTALFYFYFSSHLNIDVGVIEKERRRVRLTWEIWWILKNANLRLLYCRFMICKIHKDSLIIRERF